MKKSNKNFIQIILSVILIGILIYFIYKVVKSSKDKYSPQIKNNYTKRLETPKSQLQYIPKKVNKKLKDGGGGKSIQEQIEDELADRGSKAALKAGLSVDSKSIKGILDALYGEFKNPNDPQSNLNLIKAVGVAILDTAFACAGLGFLSGILDNLLASTPNKNPPPTGDQLVNQLETWFAVQFNNQILLSSINQLQNNISYAQQYLKIYMGIKSQIYSFCPPSGNSCALDYSNTRCDSYLNNYKAIDCMKNPSGESSNPPQYDPSMILYNNSTEANGATKRAYLLNALQNPPPVNGTINASLKSLADYGIINIINIFSNLPTLDTSPLSKNGNRSAYVKTINSLYQTLNLTITSIIGYYQELALIDTHNNGTVYYNAWASTALGILNIFPDKNQGQTLFQNTPGSLLYFLQTMASYPSSSNGIIKFNTTSANIDGSYYNYIINLFYFYFINLYTSTTQSIGCQNGGFLECINEIRFQDVSGVIPSTYYSLICQKYNDYAIEWDMQANYCMNNPPPCIPPQNTVQYYGQNVFITQKYNPDPSFIQSFMVKILGYYNEFLNFPFDTYLSIAKMAGVKLSKPDGTTPTALDLFNNMVYMLFTTTGSSPNTNPIFTAVPGSLPPYINISSSADPSGGYPFGLDKPSYFEAYNVLNSTSPPTDNSTIDSYNTYCTSAVNIIPGSNFDASFFNIPGDNTQTYTNNMKCYDTTANVIKSCLLPGVSPGDMNYNVTKNSRKAYCINTHTNTYSDLQSVGSNPTPAPNTGPQPPESNLKCWTIPPPQGQTTNIQQVILTPNGTWAVNTTNFENLTWNGLTASFTLNNVQSTLTFDQYENIINCSTNIGNITIPVYCYITDQPNYILQVPPNNYACWDLLNDGTQILRMDSKQNFTWNGNIFGGLEHQYTSFYYMITSTSQEITLMFGENCDIIFNGNNGSNKPVSYYLAAGYSAALPGKTKYYYLQTENNYSYIVVDDNGDIGQYYPKAIVDADIMNGSMGNPYGLGSRNAISNYSNEEILTIKFSSVWQGKTQDSSAVFGQNEAIVAGTYAGEPLINLPYYPVQHTSTSDYE